MIKKKNTELQKLYIHLKQTLLQFNLLAVIQTPKSVKSIQPKYLSWMDLKSMFHFTLDAMIM